MEACIYLTSGREVLSIRQEKNKGVGRHEDENIVRNKFQQHWEWKKTCPKTEIVAKKTLPTEDKETSLTFSPSRPGGPATPGGPMKPWK